MLTLLLKQQLLLSSFINSFHLNMSRSNEMGSPDLKTLEMVLLKLNEGGLLVPARGRN
jgi:hypothetical protein